MAVSWGWSPSLPLDGARRLAGDVVSDAVDAGDLVDDAPADDVEEVVGEAGPVGRHGVLRRDRPEDDGVRVGPAVALDPHRADGGKDGEGLPDVAIEPGLVDLLAHDCVGGAEH